MRIVAGPSRRLVRRALTCLGAAGGTTCVCGKRALAREVARAFGGRERACHVVVWRGGEPPTDPSRDIRVLTPAYAGVVRERYAHPEYLVPGELAWAEVWPENDASLALERAMGFEVRPEDALWFVS